MTPALTFLLGVIVGAVAVVLVAGWMLDNLETWWPHK